MGIKKRFTVKKQQKCRRRKKRAKLNKSRIDSGKSSSAEKKDTAKPSNV